MNYQHLTSYEHPMALNPEKTRRRKTATVPRTKKKASTASLRHDFELLVGEETYKTWTSMLRQLVPSGRTHRISVVVAGMLYYASLQERIDDNAVSEIFDEIDGMDYEDTESQLLCVVEQLFTDAKVKWKRTNSKGHGYSIAEAAIHEYFSWDMMPWE